jgi:histidinol dehydrogenase
MARELRALPPDVVASGDVREVISEVRRRGDEAVLELGERFDGVRPGSLRVEAGAISDALESLDRDLRESLEVAVHNIRTVAQAQTAGEPHEIELPEGQRVSIDSIPVRSAGIYAPGGRAAYPSSVLMCALAAHAAGVERIALASPPGEDGRPHPLVLAAAAACEVSEVYAMGGAQAIAAMALGTETIERVDVIAGPGNAFVTEAKRQLYGEVGIDSVAGPSELMVVLGEGGNPEWAARDLCAQAEHGAEGLIVACAVSAEALGDLASRVEALAAESPSVADTTMALVELPDTDTAVDLANELAPEHLQLMCSDAELLARRVRTAGCVFCGNEAGTAFGDYAAGSNHVLPTGGAGRFAGPLGPDAFRRRISLVSLPAAAARALAPHVERLARAEGFPVHAESAAARGGEGPERS